MNVSAVIEDSPLRQAVMNNAGQRQLRSSLEPLEIAGALFPFSVCAGPH